MQVFREKMCRNFVPMKRALGTLDDFFNPLESCIRDLLSKLDFYSLDTFINGMNSPSFFNFSLYQAKPRNVKRQFIWLFDII